MGGAGAGRLRLPVHYMFNRQGLCRPVLCRAGRANTVVQIGRHAAPCGPILRDPFLWRLGWAPR